jgi:sulfur-oxidizing protein SoxY
MLALLLPWRRAGATPEQLQDAMTEVLGGRPLRAGKVTIDVPPLVENGNAVPITVKVDHPMTDQAFVKAIHVFNEKNPQPHVISVVLGPYGGRAQFSTRIKLAASQNIIAVAELQDGSLWRGQAPVVVTIAACVEEGP